MRFGDLLFASKARSGPCQGRGQSHLFTQKGTLSTLLLSLQGLRGIGPALAGKRGGGGAFALCARDGFVRLQGSLRADPAALRFYGAPRERSYAR